MCSVDEVKIERFGYYHQRYAWREKKAALDEKNTLHGCRSITLCVAARNTENIAQLHKE